MLTFISSTLAALELPHPHWLFPELPLFPEFPVLPEFPHLSADESFPPLELVNG